MIRIKINQIKYCPLPLKMNFTQHTYYGFHSTIQMFIKMFSTSQFSFTPKVEVMEKSASLELLGVKHFFLMFLNFKLNISDVKSILHFF